MRRTVATIVVALVAASGLAACGKRDTRLDEVLAAVRRTQRAPHRYVYVDDRPGNELLGEPSQEYKVFGLVEDDFRFKARAEVNGVPSFDEVVMDDLLAIRFLDPGRLGQLLDRSKLNDPEISKETDIEGITVLDALQAKRWVVDPAGAPPVTSLSRPEKELGGDPIVDSLTVLTYVADSAKKAQSVRKWSEDDLEPAYPASEDDFAKPEKGETRYDLVRPRLPAISTTGGGAPAAGGQAAFPATQHFRKMAIYVKDGLIVRVHEEIEVKGKFLDSVIKYVKKSIEQSRSQEAIEGFEEFQREVPEAEQGTALLQFLSFGLQSFGQDPIMVRNMKVELQDFGDEIVVDMPTEGLVAGSLAILRTSSGSQASQSTPVPSGATATTVVASSEGATIGGEGSSEPTGGDGSGGTSGSDGSGGGEGSTPTTAPSS